MSLLSSIGKGIATGLVKVFSIVRMEGEAAFEKKIGFLLMLIGKAFGPEGILHFSELSIADQQALLVRVPVLRTAHADWPAPLDQLPRTISTWIPTPDYKPLKLAGNTASLKPIPARGEWFVTRGYFAWKSDDGWYFRFGFRYDDVDAYLSFPAITIKKYA